MNELFEIKNEFLAIIKDIELIPCTSGYTSRVAAIRPESVAHTIGAITAITASNRPASLKKVHRPITVIIPALNDYCVRFLPLTYTTSSNHDK